MLRIALLLLAYSYCLYLPSQVLPDTLITKSKDSIIPNFPLELYSVAASEYNDPIPLDTLLYVSNLSSFNSQISLNNLGTAVQLIHPKQYYDPLGHGYQSYMPYWMDNRSFSYLYSNKSITDISYKQSRSLVNSQTTFQNNYHLNIVFASTFNKKINVTLKYNKLSHQGIYAHQRNKQSSFATGVRYTGPKKLFSINFLYIWNLTKAEENNGITVDSFLNLPGFRIRSSMPVYSNSAIKDLNENQFAIQYQLRFHRQDSSAGNPTIFIHHSFKKFTYNFTDNQPITSALYYGLYYVDSNSIQNIFKQGVFHNGIRFQLIDNYKLKTGITASYDYGNNDYPTLSLTSQLFQIGAYANLNYFKKIPLQLEYSFSSKSKVPTQNIKGALHHATSRLQSILTIFHSEYYPTLLHEKLYINDKIIRNQSLKPIGETGAMISASFSQKFLPAIEFKYSIYDHYIGYDKIGMIRQLGQNIHSFELSLISELNWSWFGIHNAIRLHSFQPDDLYISQWNSDHELMIRLNLFKKAIHAQIGLYANIQDIPKRLNYQSITGTFYASDENFKPYMTNGLRFRFKVSSFLAHVDLDYIDSFWNTQRPYLVNIYPIYDFYFRFGIQWRMFY